MKIAYVERKFQGAALALIEKCNEIVEEYQSQSLRLTLRQLYYQLVSRNVIPNQQKAYKRLGGILSDARLAGLVDWAAIEDRVRVPEVPPEWSSIEEIVEEYQSQSLRLTLRQLYYQLVSRNVIPNQVKAYKRLGSVLSDARLAGLVDWAAIEDRVRVPEVPSEWSSIEEIVEAAIVGFRLPRWNGQARYVELWVEKDALAGVLAPIAHEYHVTLMVNRGYSSSSAMYESAQRFRRHRGQEMHVLYLGDHDPSGEDMVRDIRDRMRIFGVRPTVEKIALTTAQVEEYNPPENPVKMTDSRSPAYRERFGDSCWEVDALPPTVLRDLIVTRIEQLVDMDAINEVREQEEKQKGRLIDKLREMREEE